MKKNWHYRYLGYILRVCRHYLRSDKYYRVRKFRKTLGYRPNLLNPESFNEKILYRMIHPMNETIVSERVDKLKVKEYVRCINKNIVPEVYGVYRSVNDIDISSFPERFVLKCNHDSGGVVVCEDKSTFDFDSAKSKLSFHLKTNMYYRTREWQYKNIKPLIFCEEFIDRASMKSSGLIPDIFRFHCFNAVALYAEVEFYDDKNNYYTNVYDRTWERQDVRLNSIPCTPSVIAEPEKFSEAIQTAELLSKGLDYCRIDLYITSTSIYFSEFTFSPGNGGERFYPAEWDFILGKHWELHRISR